MDEEFPISSKDDTAPAPHYALYRRRWLGLACLVIVNISIALSYIVFGSIAENGSTFFRVNLTAVNWLSASVCAMYLVVSPIVSLIASRYSCRFCVLIASACLIIGSWIRYGAARAQSGTDQSYYGLLFVGQLFLGVAQPFAQIIATLFSEQFMSEQSRTTSTMLIAISNPIGCALAGILAPAIVTSPKDITTLLLVTAIVGTVCGAIGFCMPAKPPLAPSRPATVGGRRGILVALKAMFTFSQPQARELVYIFCIFSALVAAFQAWTTFVSQIFVPNGYSNDEAGFFAATAIGAGLVFALFSSPLLDRSRLAKRQGLIAKVLVTLLAFSYIALIFVARPNAAIGIYVLMAFIGICSFTLLPIALELSAEISFALNLSPDASSALLYLGGNGVSVITLVVEDALRNRHDQKMTRSLVFQAVLVAAASMLVFGVSGKQERKQAPLRPVIGTPQQADLSLNILNKTPSSFDSI